MATYSAIPDANLDPDSPARSIDALALRDNPIAIAEGAAGAPRVENAAFKSVSAGAVESWRLFGSDAADVPTSNTAYLAATDASYFENYTSSLGVRVMVAGVVTVSLEHRQTVGNISFARVLLNGTLHTEWSTSSASFVSRTANIGVAYGDVIVIQHRSNGSDVRWRGLKITADKQFWCNSAVGV